MAEKHKNEIFVDGDNVARSYDENKAFSVIGLLRCAVYFRQRHYAPKIILNRNVRTVAVGGKLKDGDELLKLESGSTGLLHYAPVGCDEKGYLIQAAYDSGGIIVSNDGYEAQQASNPDISHFLSHRVLRYHFTNNEFMPIRPVINGRVMEVEEFLNSAYEGSADSTSAAALTRYLLTMKMDENGENLQLENGQLRPGHGIDSDHSSSSQRRTRNNSSFRRGGHSRTNRLFQTHRMNLAQPAQRRYTVGKIVAVTSDTATIEFHVKEDIIFTKFGKEVYHPNGRPARDLCREFRVGDWVGFVSEKHQEYRHGQWKVVEVRKKGEMKRGYGQFRPLTNGSASGIIEARYKNEAGGGDVFFPGAAFRGDSSLQHLKKGHWLYYYAFDQKPSAGCTAVAVEVFPASAAGIIVKKTPEQVYVWSLKTGVAVGSSVEYAEGTWVRFQFQQNPNAGSVRWIIKDVESAETPAGLTIDPVEGEDSIITIRCVAVIGVMTEKYGSVWTEPLGRMKLTPTCLKNVLKAEPDGLKPYQPVRILAYTNGRLIDRHSDYSSADETVAAVSTSRSAPKTTTETWQVMSLLVGNGATAVGVELARPPPSIIFGVEAVVLECLRSGSDPCWMLGSEKYGKILATSFDLVNCQKPLHPGDRVKASIIPQPLANGDEYRAFVVEKMG